jgi:DNA-binding NarL/FixJ family response regulator
MSDSSSFTGTITRLLRQLPTNDEQVVQEVFNFYFQNLARRAKKLLSDLGGVIASDEEDLAMLVMTSFLKDATAGELGELRSRHDVWRMLSKRVRLRAINMVRDERRNKGKEVGESSFRDANGGIDPTGIDQQVSRNIDDLTQYHQELIEAVTDPTEQQIATLLLEGKDVNDISNQLGKSPATIYRKLKIIEDAWEGYCREQIAP